MDAKMKVERAAAGAAIDGVLKCDRWCFKICESRRRQNKSAVESDGFCTEIYRKYVCGENLRQHPHHAAESGQQMGTVCQPRTGRAGSAGDQNDCFEPGIPGSFRRNETDPYEP